MPFFDLCQFLDSRRLWTIDRNL